MNLIVNTKNIISISEARTKLMSISANKKLRQSYMITKNGKPDMYLMPQEEIESWLETVLIAKDFPNILKESLEARKSFEAGEYITLDQFVKNKNAQSNSKQKSQQRIRKNS